MRRNGLKGLGYTAIAQFVWAGNILSAHWLRGMAWHQFNPLPVINGEMVKG